MSNQNIDNLKCHIGDMRLLVESQKQLVNRSLECLGQTKRSLAVTKIVKRISDESLSAEEQQQYEALIIEACDTASKQILALGKMEAELREMENQLLFHGASVSANVGLKE